MNTILQNILVFIVTAIALGFLVRKFFWKSQKKNITKTCGNNGCGCH